MLAACSLVLLTGFALQVAAYRHGGHTSISDIPRLVLHHDLTPGHWPYVDRELEYPVLAGLLLGAAVSIGSAPFGSAPFGPHRPAQAGIGRHVGKGQEYR